MSAAALAQEAAPHTLPFASTGHTLELEVARTATDEESTAAPTAVTVRLTDAPAWLAVTPAEVTLDALVPGTDALARFAFDVAEDAPVGEPGAMTFTVTSVEGLAWTKTVRVEVAPPADFALAAAYPNPFGARPATLAFDLPRAAEVRLVVYDLLGREVARLVDGPQEAGRHTVELRPESLASGVYVVRFTAEAEAGERAVEHQKLTLVR
ncbi:MAG: T9SS type A sorting domain-containing protein [Bacteroidota bacterium]